MCVLIVSVSFLRPDQSQLFPDIFIASDSTCDKLGSIRWKDFMVEGILFRSGRSRSLRVQLRLHRGPITQQGSVYMLDEVLLVPAGEVCSL